MIVVIVLTFFFTLLIGIPISFVLGITSLGALLVWGKIPFDLISQRMFTGVDSFPLMAIPFFMLAGLLMNEAGITKPLIDFSDSLVGKIKGGLAHVNIVASMFFAGITGSAVADASALGSILIPTMLEQGYDRDYSAAVCASASVIGPIIPPSIVMVVYAMTASISIGGLFIAGIVPGILLGLSLMIVAYIYAIKRNYQSRKEAISFFKFIVICKRAILPLLMPIIILGGILFGIFTPTEAAAVAVAYAFFIGVFVTKKLKIVNIPKIFIEAGVSSAIVLFIISTANIFSWILATQQVPQKMSNLILSLSNDTWVILLLLNILLLIVGCFLETSAAILIFVPILIPIINVLGIHPLHFGMIVVLNLCIGIITPPLGVCLFVVSRVANIEFESIVKAILPFLLAEIVVLIIITYLPIVSMFLPKLLGYY